MSNTQVEISSIAPSLKISSKPYGKIVLTLKNCLLPESKLLPTPSQVDGLDCDIEVDQRILGCEMIQTAGILLKLPQVAMATGQVLFQRFYYSKSFVRHAMDTTAMGCVCLASKIEEAPRRIRDVINVFHHIKQMKGQKQQDNGHCLSLSLSLGNMVQLYKEYRLKVRATSSKISKILPPSCLAYLATKHQEKCSIMHRSNAKYITMLNMGYSEYPRRILPMMLDQTYISLKSQVIKAERRVLKELGFCVHVKHPHKIIVMYLQVLGYEKNVSLMQLAWNYMNDALRTDLFVRYQPETVACACIYLTSRKLGVCLPKSPAWYKIFRVCEEDLQDVCYRILRLYKRPKPNADELERKVEDLRRHYQEIRTKARGNNSNHSEANTPASSPTPTIHANHPVSVSAKSPEHKKDKRAASPRWTGFIMRSTNNHNIEKRKSRTKSPVKSPSIAQSKHSKKSKKSSRRSLSRSRSRSRSRKNSNHRKHRSSISRSVSLSPLPAYSRHSRKPPRDKSRYRSRSRSPKHSDNYDRTYDSKYYDSKSGSKTRSKVRSSGSRTQDQRR